MTDKREVMPIIDGAFLKAIPWWVISGHEKQAQDNHGQTLTRLAERGGLGTSEAWAIINKVPWRRWDEPACERALMRLSSKTPQAVRRRAA